MADTYEKDLGQKSAVTISDYVRLVGTDNVSYKQPIYSMCAPYSTPSGTDLLSVVKALNQGTYFYRMDSVSGFPVSGGVVYRIVKTHGAGDARASIIAVPMDANANIYTTFITSASASSITWVAQPTRAEVDALTTKTSVPVTAATNVVIDVNNSYKLGKTLFLNVKGHTTANVANAYLFTFSGASPDPYNFTFGIPIGSGAWEINSIAYGYINQGAVTATIQSGKYFHIAQAFICS